jgi:hypothetical protein
MLSQRIDRRARRIGRSPQFESLEDRLPLTASPTVVDFEVSSSQWTTPFNDYLVAHSLGTHGYRVPTGSASQIKSLPWKNIDTLIVTFNEDVDVRRDHLSISGVSATNFTIQQFSYDIDSHRATWVFSAPLGPNSYSVEVDGDGVSPVKNLGGAALDGEWTTSTSAYPSGNAVAGGDFTFAFRVLIGDANQSNTVDYYDYYGAVAKNGLTTTSTGYSPLYDFNGSGDHSTADANEASSRMWATYPSGTPVGATNDAPTTRGGGYYRLAPGAVDLAINLWDQFADAETSDSALTYQVISTSNGALWSSQSINSGAGTLNLAAAPSALGRSYVVVRATDSQGQFTDARYVVDVGDAFGIPCLTFSIENLEEDTWEIEGTVADDGPLEGLLVKFSGVVNCAIRVDSMGSFSITVTMEVEDWGDVIGTVYDWDGGLSNQYVDFVGIS